MDLVSQILTILLIFYGTAYISFSAKDTGLFAYIAEQTLVRHWKGWHISLVIFIVSGLLCFLTDNDVVILTLTPMLLHLHGPHDMRKLLLIQFAAANTFSLFSLISNPTNVIIANQFNLDYLQFLELMWPIGLLAAASVVLLIPKYTMSAHFTVPKLTKLHTQLVLSALGVCLLLALLATERLTGIDLWISVLVMLSLFLLRDGLLGKIRTTIAQLPRRAGIVIAAGFVVVGLLGFIGTTETAASLLSQLPFIPAAIVVTIVSILLAAVIVNIPMAILMSGILLHVDFPVAQQIGLVTLVFMASDISTLIFRRASLAGHMWHHMIEQDDGEPISKAHFTRALAPAGIFATLVVLVFVIIRST